MKYSSTIETTYRHDDRKVKESSNIPAEERPLSTYYEVKAIVQLEVPKLR